MASVFGASSGLVRQPKCVFHVRWILRPSDAYSGLPCPAMKLAVVLAACSLVLGCDGPSMECTGDCPAGLTVAFSGAWTGQTTLTTSQGTLAGPGALTVSVSGYAASIEHVCLDGSGSLVVSGSADFASWAGTLVCQPFEAFPCASSTIIYAGATATVSTVTTAPNQLTFVATGTAIGCGVGQVLSFTFVGEQRQCSLTQPCQ